MFKKGEQVFIRTVTHYYTGKVIFCGKGYVELGHAAWVADTGRFHDALMKGTLSEVEPFPDSVKIPLTAIVDATLWRHQLPRVQK